MKIILSGPPGSGKGTQADLLVTKYNFIHFSTGDVFREEIAKKTPIGITVESYVKDGRLVPDEITLEITKNFLIKNKNQNIIFDGFPRTLPQAQGLDKILLELNDRIDYIIFIDLPDNEIVERLTARRTCPNCGAIYNLNFSPPKIPDICDNCGTRLIQRPDDTEEIIRKRLLVYRNQTLELKTYYENSDRMYVIDGSLGRDRVHQEIIKILGLA
ncbi:MAG: adenylate kinase [candidate division WOR-3 bacterium]|nr:adenylate kinase [candidate division WOR-3 bacterium]MDW7987336.1 adenylate kinase [candidate division WOR-3 bacterium]